MNALRAVTWPQRVALDNSIEDLQETYRLMFPDKSVLPLIFGLADLTGRRPGRR